MARRWMLAAAMLLAVTAPVLAQAPKRIRGAITGL